MLQLLYKPLNGGHSLTKDKPLGAKKDALLTVAIVWVYTDHKHAYKYTIIIHYQSRNDSRKLEKQHNNM